MNRWTQVPGLDGYSVSDQGHIRMERWVQVPGFDGYSVSDQGRIRNDNTGLILRQSQNQSGLTQVGMMRNGIQCKRGVAGLVANSFIPHDNEHFDTPINLNGDRRDNRVENLAMRPRWFAVQYHKQFDNDKPAHSGEVLDVETGDVYPSSREVAMTFGLLDKEVLLSALNKTYAWPTYQRFELLEA